MSGSAFHSDSSMTLPRRFVAVACFLALVFSSTALPDTDQAGLVKAIEDAASSIERLQSDRADLVDKMASAPPPSQADMQASLDKMDETLEGATKRFEQLATGGVDLSVFSTEPVEFDWRSDIMETLRPMFDNLKLLTEKPRRISDLRRQMERLDSQAEAARRAYAQLSGLVTDIGEVDQAVSGQLTPLEQQWRERLDTIEQERELAQVRLDRLLGESTHWGEDIKDGFIEFAKGRGLTILLAVVATLVTLWCLRLVASLGQGTRFDPTRRKARPAWRMIGFACQSLFFVLPLMAALLVFNLRGDLLLLALAAVLAFFGLLGLRDFLPKYIAEARVLLNLGSAREGERVMHNGLPLEVVSLNVNSILRNPLLHGSVRLPLGTMVDLVSRHPVADEAWFPCKMGDVLLTPDDEILEVCQQTTEQVELKTVSGDVRYLPSADVYAWGARNLSAGGTFGVTQVFGLDYGLQQKVLDEVPEALKAGVLAELKAAGFQDHVSSVIVELKVAGSSSLDFLIYVGLHSDMARRYFRLQRLLQQACVRVCNENDWSIPFPQLTVHRAP